MFSNRYSLNRKLILLVVSVMGISSLLLLLFLYGIYQMQLQNERRQASEQVNELLQATLENAMLKRDLPGLQSIIDKLASQQSIERVIILNPSGEIRFASDQSLLHGTLNPELKQLCPGCTGDFSQALATTHFLRDHEGTRVLRSVNPVKNQQPCNVCHGPTAKHPVNGILVIDYDAEPIMTTARSGLLGLLLAGLLVISLTFLSIWWFMRRQVLQPVRALTDTSEQIYMGNLDARVGVKNRDEFSQLSDTFNGMAERLQSSVNQLLDKEDYLQGLIDAIPDAVRVVDDQFHILKANKSYRDLLGKAVTENACCYRHSHDREKPCIPTLTTCPLVEIKKNGKPLKVMQTFIDVNGKPLSLQVFSAPLTIVDEHRQPRFCIVQSIRDLQHDINYSQEQRLAELGQLAAGVGHEILNPLFSIRIALRSTLKNLKESMDSQDESIQYMELVDGEIDKCIDVTKRLLKLSTPAEYRHQLININLAIRETVSLLKYEGDQNSIDIVLRLDPEMPRVLAAESDMRMLTLNLVQNAFHAMPDGGVLTILTRTVGKTVEALFCDTGVGIPDENMPHIFEPFFSQRASGKRGMGLGLSICHSITEQCGGSILAENRMTGGTCMTVTLPVAVSE